MTFWLLLLCCGLRVTLGEEEDVLCHASCICLDSFFQCGGKGLKSLPPRLPSWITALDVSGNEMVSVDPDTLRPLLHLQSLSVDRNNLSSIPTTRNSPADTSTLRHFTNLSLARNGIEWVESWRLEGFPGLLELDLSRNLIQGLSNTSFPSSSPLVHLNLDANLLETLDTGSLDPLSNLKDLHLAKNKIRFIAKDALSRLKSLEKLDLSRNKLSTVDSLRFQGLKKLQVLNLRRNPMTNLSDAAFYGLDNIQHLYLEWSGIGMMEQRWLYGLRSLRSLNLSHNQITAVQDEACIYLENLHTLDLSANSLEGLRKKTFTGLGALRSLDLSGNRISELEADAFLPLGNLEALDLSDNGLSWAVEDMGFPFRGLGNLSSLNLGGNQIHFLHGDALRGLQHLTLLNLSSNPLAWLSERSLLPVPHAGLLLHSVSSLLCDCEVLWLQARLSAPRLRHSGPTCAFPRSLANRSLLLLPPSHLSCPDNSPKPMFVREPRSEVLLMEGGGELGCIVQSYLPVQQIQWRKDHADLPPHLEGGVEQRVEGGGPEELFLFHSTLSFKNVSWEDVGAYQCVARNDLAIVYSAKANITVHVFPTFVKRPSNVTVRLGSIAKLECGAKGWPAPEIGFQKDGGEDFPAALERRFHVMPNDDSFFIMQVKLADMGIYSCSATNPAGVIRANASVTVYDLPTFRQGMEDESAVEGSNAILECIGTGSPQPFVSWSKEGVAIAEGRDKRFHLTENGSLLLIKDVQGSDAGRYECVLSNAVGTARGSSTLTVLSGEGVMSLSLDNAAMTIIFIIIAVFCVVVTSAAWVVVIYRTRKRIKSTHQPSTQSPLLPHSKFLELERESPFTALPYTQIAKVMCGGDGESEGSGKDSGTGEDIPEGVELEDLLRRQPRSMETFGPSRAPSRSAHTQLQQPLRHYQPAPRPDLKAHPPTTKGKSIAIPLPPPLPHPPSITTTTAATVHGHVPKSSPPNRTAGKESESSPTSTPV